MKRFLALLLLAAAVTVQADPVLLKDVNTGIRIPTEAPVQMGAYWYFSSCNDGIGCELWRTDGTGPGTSLVADIRPGSRGSSPTALTVIGDTFYFAANDGTHGVELWKSDGTAQGTMLVRDIVPGSQHSSPESLVAAGGQLFFTAAVPGTGRELWKSDGTAGGTNLVKDINPGEGPSAIPVIRASGSLVVFTALDDVSGWEPWRSDGTLEGTFQLRDVTPGSESSFPTIYQLAGPHVFFSTFSEPSSGTYVTDGTVDGTIRVGPPAVQEKFTATGSRVYFQARDEESTGYELWVSDGTLAGTHLVRDINPGPANSLDYVYSIAPMGSGVVFLADDGTTGLEPWFSDGSAAGTVQLGDLYAGPAPYLEPGFTSVGGTTVFFAWANGHGPSLWATDGTPAGTRLVKTIVPDTLRPVLGKVGPHAILIANDGIHGKELWRTDGTTEGTVLLADQTKGPAGYGGDTAILAAHAIGDHLLFATDPTFTSYVTDGMPGEPVALAPAPPQPTKGSNCGETSRSVGRLVFFVAFDPAHGCELWRTDATPAGTFLVKDIWPGPAGSRPSRLAAAGGWLYFTARDGEGAGDSVWRTDGTEAGTARVESDFARSGFVVAGDSIYFLAATLPWAYVEPWRSVIGSTVALPLSSLKPGLALKSSEHLVATGGMVYFVADDFVHGVELWRSDGTGDGTRLVKDLAPGSLTSIFIELGVAAGKAFFSGPGGVLWASDGTDPGTAPLADSSGASVPGALWFTSAGSQVFFAQGTQLWRSDGTPAGTRAVGAFGFNPQMLVAAGPWAYFKVDDPEGRDQLWRSDGTGEGTVLVREFTDEVPNWSLGLTPFGQRLYFHAQDALGNTLTYRTEGTAATTVALFGIPAVDILATGSLSPAATASGYFVFDLDLVAGLEPAFLASEPGLDADGDGIPDLLELDLGRDPQKKDNDILAPGPVAATLFAMQQYRDFLGREGDPAGVQGWTDLLVAGTYSRPQVIDAFLSSDEFAGTMAPVVRLYFATYLRVPDYAGLMFNAGLVRSGTITLLQLADYFAAGPEFTSLYGALDNMQFVTLLYNTVLGRTPDPPGLAGWVALLEGGMSRGQVLMGFSESPEYQAAVANEVFVTMMYTGMLRRSPEPTGLSDWVQFLDAGTYSREQVINGFILSTEYHDRLLPN